jgi:alpha/beta superfamily hydrolase
VREERLSFPAQDGLMLEGLFSREEEGVRGWIILCHPHPLYGGNMYNNVVESLQGSLAQKGFSTLRFNFRGVGKSEGGYSEGTGELEDVRGALDFIATVEKDEVPLYLVGYSFGAYVGAKAVSHCERVMALCCISPPVHFSDFSFLRDEKRPKCIIAGDRDLVCPLEKLEEFFLSLPHPKVLHIIPGADHFWWRLEDQVVAHMTDFLEGL